MTVSIKLSNTFSKGIFQYILNLIDNITIVFIYLQKLSK
jgi:hypothetical protein